MTQALQPWQLVVSILAVWINEHQQAALEYLREENRVSGNNLAKSDGGSLRKARSQAAEL
jgi:hypothetical protein